MERKKGNIVRLGVFVLAGLGVLLVALFLIGKNQHLIGSHLTLRAHFRNVAGLRVGNNVRYAGIEVGTVKKMEIVNDTTLEVTMLVDKEMRTVIRRNALASLGADGLMGNKVVNIVPQSGEYPYVVSGDLLASRHSVEIDDVLRTLSGTSENIRDISEGLKVTVSRINDSEGLWKLLSDKSLAGNIRRATENLERATANADVMTRDVREVIADVKAGKGPVGTMLRDTLMEKELRSTVSELEAVAGHAQRLATDLDAMARNIDRDINEGKGPVNLVLKDTAITGNITRTLGNVEKGTYNFNENMEALKQNFLFRGYFRKKEKEKARAGQSQ
jgi:phospholipid/cholesterol/gamma-HCH transport system substrate-binding protein